MKAGFTLVEIMIVVAIIGLLAAISVPAFNKVRSNTTEKTALNNARMLATAVEQASMEVMPPIAKEDVEPYLRRGWASLDISGTTALLPSDNITFYTNNTEIIAQAMYP